MVISKFQKYAQRAQKILAGGFSRPAVSQQGNVCSLIVAHAKGAKFYDMDDREYTDYYLSGGAHILGHANPNVVLSAKKYAERGLGFGLMTQAEIDLAAYLIAHIPSMEKVCFVHSAREAVFCAMRLARCVTGRRIALSLGRALPDSTVLSYNDAAAVERFVTEHAHDIACIVCEPVCVDKGLIVADKIFFEKLVQVTKRQGILLIMDETRTGFRGFPGGSQSLLNIRPDLTCLGAIIGGGFPIGAYGGRADVMDRLVMDGQTTEASSLAANPVILRAGLMALKLMTDSFYRALNDKAQRFADQLNAFFVEQQIEARIDWYYSMLFIRFFNDQAGNYHKLAEHLFKQGIYFPASEHEPFFISGSHSKKDLAALRQEVEGFFQEGKDAER